MYFDQFYFLREPYLNYVCEYVLWAWRYTKPPELACDPHTYEHGWGHRDYFMLLHPSNFTSNTNYPPGVFEILPSSF